jgi:UDP-3-O-acyl N-acetylglucosamine deacetylase
MNKGRILIVDDQEEILNSLEGILADEGYEVIPARDGREALHSVQNESPDVVFLDIWIPGIDGMQTLKAIKRIDPECAVVMMSGHGTIETAVKAIKLGATDYLEKPLNLEDVLHLVEKAVASKSVAAQTRRESGPASELLIGKSKKAAQLRRALENAASEAESVWLVGDKGAGKEFAARIIHRLGAMAGGSLIKVRCSELTDESIEDVLLGRENGSHGRRPGKLNQAIGGTLLLSGIDRLEQSLRSRIGELVRGFFNKQSGSPSPAVHRGRIVSTSMLSPETLVKEDGFPQELIDLLAGRIIRIPPLSERAEDIPLFLDHFLNEAADEFDRDIRGPDDAALARLLEYSWPGNVKEMKILMEHVVMTAPGPKITVGDLLIPGTETADQNTAGEGRSGHNGTARTDGSKGKTSSEKGRTHVSSAVPPTPADTNPRQKTLQGRVVMYGQGLHSGTKTGLTLSPLPPGSGILFGHITSGGTVPAVIDNVQSTELATSLNGTDCSAKTIEHLMAVLHVYGLTNLLVTISGEVPIMDGSAVEFCNLVEGAEIISQDEPVQEIRIEEAIELPISGNGGKSMRVEPSDVFEVEYFMDYPKPIGKLHMTYRCDDPQDFKEQIAPARTFGFVKDMRMMDEMGLASGGKLSNVVLLDEEKVVNPPLRFPDEFIRHKILDIIGDFYLLGHPFRGKVIARQTGHTENIAMLKLIREKLPL